MSSPAGSASGTASALQDGRVPIVLGVTGHRTLPDEALMEQKVREQFQALRERYPHSPFCILSPLAEGADRLVARLAIEVVEARLFVPLPMPEEEYRRDFSGPEALAEYDDLRSRADAVFELELSASDEDLGFAGEDRNQRYARTGMFVADRAQVLFALWDGEEADGTGGTGDIARWALEGKAPRAYLMPEAQDRPFYYPNETELVHIHSHTGEIEIRLGSGNNVRPSLNRLDQYNEEVQAAGASTLGSDEHVAAPLFGEAASTDCVQDRVDAHLLATHTAADALSIALRTRFHRVLKVIYGLSAGGIVGFALLDLWPAAIALCLICTVAALGLLRWTERKQLENRYLHARALAEGLRVSTFWALAGVRQHVHEHYFGSHAGETAWTRMALQNVETVGRTPQPIRPAETEPVLDLVKEKWVYSQRRYYDQSRRDARRQAHWFERWANLAFGLSFLVAAAIGAYVAFSPTVSTMRIEYAMVGIELALAFGVSFQAYKSKLGLDALQRHYEKAYSLFQAAHHRLADRPEEAVTIFRDLGREALLENGNWLWMNQSRDVETPTVA